MVAEEVVVVEEVEEVEVDSRLFNDLYYGVTIH